MGRAKLIFSSLQGIWKLTRYIVLKEPFPKLYEGAGYAVLSKESTNELKYEEMVRLKNLSMRSEIKGRKTYKYIYNPERDIITKYFDNSELFYELDISGINCSGKYLCVRDFYKAIYTFNNDSRFSLKYLVKGPEKDYAINTVYNLIDGRDRSSISYYSDRESLNP